MVTFVAARAELHVSDFSKLLKKLNHMTSVHAAVRAGASAADAGLFKCRQQA